MDCMEKRLFACITLSNITGTYCFKQKKINYNLLPYTSPIYISRSSNIIADKRGAGPPPIPKPRRVRPRDWTLVARDIFSHQPPAARFRSLRATKHPRPSNSQNRLSAQYPGSHSALRCASRPLGHAPHRMAKTHEDKRPHFGNSPSPEYEVLIPTVRVVLTTALPRVTATVDFHHHRLAVGAFA